MKNQRKSTHLEAALVVVVVPSVLFVVGAVLINERVGNDDRPGTSCREDAALMRRS